MDNRFLIWLSMNGKAVGRIFLILLIIAFFIPAFMSKKEEQKQEVITQSKQEAVVEIPSKYLGEFSISHYCSCPICTSTPKGSRTATGHIPREGRTVAVDTKLIPLHSVIYIEGLGTFVAEDVGGAVKGKHLDIYIDDHQRALSLGTLGGQKLKVWVLE